MFFILYLQQKLNQNTNITFKHMIKKLLPTSKYVDKKCKFDDCHLLGDDNHHSHRRGNLKSYKCIFFFIWFVRLLALRPLLAYCASLG
jgi:hypothetical protein